jgi:uncharacterized membrane protein
MTTWTNKHYGAIIGFVLIFSMFVIGFEETILAAVIAVVGYFIGKFLDGELDVEDVRARAQGRR